jgi:O-6-methylguanine DNA methyltransferase
VWSELRRIPRGQTISYGELAHAIGNPKAVRAVGLANGKNPVSIVVPCHRVIGADGSLTGYGGGIERKRWLLAHERAGTRCKNGEGGAFVSGGALGPGGRLPINTDGGALVSAAPQRGQYVRG